jgi:molecular chaperone GrpE
MSEETIQLEDSNLEENTPEQILENEEINPTAEINKLKAELEEARDKYLRLFAEFDNFKKRTTKERLELLGSASRETLLAFLPLADDFDRAKKASEVENSTEQFSPGVELVYNKFQSILESKGIKLMESNGEVFDAEKHEAITEIPAPNSEMVGKIIDTIEKGYYLNEKIIRYAKVVVGK